MKKTIVLVMLYVIANTALAQPPTENPAITPPTSSEEVEETQTPGSSVAPGVAKPTNPDNPTYRQENERPKGPKKNTNKNPYNVSSDTLKPGTIYTPTK